MFVFVALMCFFLFKHCIADGSDLFTVKLHGGGEFSPGSGAYIGGSYRYVDNCDVDEMSMLELGSMLEECFGVQGFCDLFYQIPHVTDCCLISKDEDVLSMCAKLDSSRMAYVYAVRAKLGETQEYNPSQQLNLEFLEIPNIDGLDDEEIEELLLENLAQPYDREPEIVVEPEVVSEAEIGSFHDDSSNIDSADDEVCATREKRKVCTENKANDISNSTVVDDHVQDPQSDISDNDYNSEEERMAANSTDEESKTYPVFNEKTDMDDPKFQLGMLFSSGNALRSAVKKHAIVHRKAIKQCRNFGKRI